MEKPGRLAYRLRFSRPVPVAISTTVGDVLHNLRAALESLAFEAARRSHGGTLTAEQEKQSTFPISKSPEALDAFFERKAKKGLLYDSRARAALRSAQPFVNLEEAISSASRWTRPSTRRSAGASCTASTPCGTSTSTGA
ncbi:MAG TPA: hypothetical protein VFA46_11700 [Actinomycetes bacterium]|jgi:hypothetical protein|nr:hypothetical protein [Actinomycetes bacterium]